MATVGGEKKDWKEEGNAAFKASKWGLAIKCYTAGIRDDPKNHLLYSNRCAAWLKMNKDHKALEDAEQCIKLQPLWAKGYYRRGCALRELLRDEEALEALREAIELAPQDAEIRSKLAEVLQRVSDKEAKWVRDIGSSSEDYESFRESLQKQETVPYSEQAVREFTKKILQNVKTRVLVGIAPRPMAHFMLGFKDEKGSSPASGMVSLDKAFESPETHASCVEFLRKYQTDMSAHAGVVVVPKSAIAFPQVWNVGGKKWRRANSEGVFVQLEARHDRGVWFIPFVRNPDGRIKAGDEESLDVDSFSIMARLFL